MIKTKDKTSKEMVAYALNMCMVSLSQIVDYGDVNILQQEYDAILNNLNIENVPKDESLLKAFKQILDVCHFYLLHSVDKEMLKRKQAARLKDALCKATGGSNIFAILGSPNPWLIATSAAAVVSVMAVKYKTERDKAKLENEIEEWALEKTALEQLHNLRRTLFETAWRLCESYDLPLGVRLSERLISAYNDAISDINPISRYERLSLLEERFCFDAYPLFYYYKGRAALEASERYVESASTYRDCARAAFDKFFSLNRVNCLLKEDVISASAYLDAASLAECRKEMLDRVVKAQETAGLNCEVIQACAFRYLLLLDDSSPVSGKLSQTDKEKCVRECIWCLRFLVSEDYNSYLNGRALSRMYKDLQMDEAYARMLACTKTKHGFVYMWMEPRTPADLQLAWNEYCQGVGMRKSIARYLDGRGRLLMKDFYKAIRAEDRTLRAQALKELLDKGWAKSVTDNDAELEFDNADPKGAIHAKFWFAKDDAIVRKSIWMEVSAVSALSAPLGMLGVVPAVVYAAYRMRKSKYQAIDPDSISKAPDYIKRCVNKLSESRWEFGQESADVRKAEYDYLSAVSNIIDGKSIDEFMLEQLYVDFVCKSARLISWVLGRVLNLNENAIRYWMGTGRCSTEPDVVKFSSAIEMQGDIMRRMAIEEGVVPEYFIQPGYFECVFPRGETCEYVDPEILFDGVK